MKHKKLFGLMGLTLGVGLLMVLPLCWWLREIYVAGGRQALRYEPLAVWLPISFLAAIGTHVLVVASLVPRRLLICIAVLLFGMTVMLGVTHVVFEDVANVLNQFISPLVVHFVALGIILGGARLLGFRMGDVASDAEKVGASVWQYSVADLMLLTTAVAVFFTMVIQFEYFWYQGSGTFQRFIWYFGFCFCVTSLAAVWGVLSKNWRWWAPVALLVSPLGMLPGWVARNTLFYEFYWYGVVTALHAGVLMLGLLVLRVNGYALLRMPKSDRDKVG